MIVIIFLPLLTGIFLSSVIHLKQIKIMLKMKKSASEQQKELEFIYCSHAILTIGNYTILMLM